MPTTPVLIPVEEYLRTVYRPDCDYVDGEVLERNMGETPHARLQGFFTFFFRTHEDEWQIDVLPELRVQVGPRRFRIPDVMLAALPNLDERIVRTPPLLCIEILSSEDRMRKVQERLDDYARMGVRSMWVIDPWRGTAFAAGADGILHEVKDRLTVEGTRIGIEVAEIFAELERLERRAAARPSAE
jgi:Uma2 family endonuclease